MSSTSVPPAKRRRIDAANETLKKPFRSPLVKRPQISPSGAEAASPVTRSPLPSRPSARNEGNGHDALSTPSRPPARRRQAPGLYTNTPSKPGSGTGTPLTRTDVSDIAGLTTKDTDLLAQLSQRRKEAEHRTREVEKQVELVRQAARIESGKEASDEKLAELVRKWRGACRVAAEELFELIRGRVDSMGGGNAWRESRRHQQGSWDDFGEGKKKGGHGKEVEEREDEREEREGFEEDGGEEAQKQDNEERVSSLSPYEER